MLRESKIIVIGIVSLGCSLLAQSTNIWKSHDLQRPSPTVVLPSSQLLPVAPPSDAVILFTGKDFSKWRSLDGSPPDWKLADGYMEVVEGAGDIWSRDVFGDVQLHIEWMIPDSKGIGQNSGNSGIFLMSQYEIQVLNSFESVTYADGQAGAVYGQYPPLVNASMPPWSWQAYDVVFRRPRFDSNGEVLQRARMTVFHNGILIQDSVELAGPTDWLHPRPYKSHPDRLPLKLQEHASKVRFRNIWIRRLNKISQFSPDVEEPLAHFLPEKELLKYVGPYEFANGIKFFVKLDQGVLLGNLNPKTKSKRVELVPQLKGEFVLRRTAARLVFDLGEDGIPKGFVFHIGLLQFSARRIR